MINEVFVSCCIFYVIIEKIVFVNMFMILERGKFMGFFSSLFKKSLQLKSTVSVEITTRSYTEILKVADNGNMPRIFLDGYQSPSGGYLNRAQFKVVGVNPKTNRKNTRIIEAITEDEAIVLAEKELISPVISEVVPYREPTERQMQKIHELEICIPNDVCFEDVSCILDRAFEYEEVVSETWLLEDECLRTVIPKRLASEELAKFAHNRGVVFSLYIAEDALISLLLNSSDDYIKTAFSAYYILRSINPTIIDDNKLDKFSEYAITNAALMKSINNRDTFDYYNPHKNTMLYKEVLKFFNITT